MKAPSDLDIQTHRLCSQGALEYAQAPPTQNSWNCVPHGSILVNCLALQQLWQDPRT